MKNLLEQIAEKNARLRCQWIDREIKKLLPQWMIYLLEKTQSKILAKCTLIEVRYYQDETGVTIEVYQFGKLKASKTFKTKGL